MNFVRPRVRFTRRALRTGLTLSCAEAGAAADEAEETLLFLHGYSDHWLSAALFLPYLPPSWRVLAPDQRGHGASDRPAGGYEIESLAADAAALLEHAGVERALVVGHSMGSLVAQRLALDHAPRVSRLVLVASSATCRGPALDELEAIVRSFGEMPPRSVVDEFQASTMARPVPPAFVEAIVAEGCRMPGRVWQALIAGFGHFDTRAELPRLAVPTRIVWGDRDSFFGRAEQEVLHAAIPGSELLVYEGTGHAPHWEEPARFARDLGDGGKRIDLDDPRVAQVG